MNWNRISYTLSLLALLIGAVSFAGWVFALDALTRIHPAWVTMKANTALCLMLAGTAVAALSDERSGGVKRRLAQGCGLAVAMVGTLTLGENLFGWDLGIDQALFPETVAGAGRSFPGRMGPASALVFMLLGAGILLLDVRTRRGAWPAQFCAAAATAVTFLVFLGYFYNVELPAAVAPYVSIALHTVIAFLLLSAALLLARPARGFAAVFLGENIGGSVARRMVPTAVLAPALLGWLFVLGREAGYYGRGAGVALLAATLTAIFTGLVWWTARAVGSTDAQRRAAEENLRRSERELSDFFDNAAEPLQWVGPDGTVLRVNDAELAMLGYPREEYLGHGIAEFHASQTVITDILSRLTAGETLTRHPAQLRCKDGSLRDVLIDSSVYYEDGRFIHTRCFTRDITEQKQIEADLLAARDAAESASRAKDEFLAALSHELRTPLTPVLMLAADMERSPDLPAPVRGDFAMIRKNVELEARLIDDLLDLTRITRGKLALHFETVDVHALITHALAILRSDCEAKNLAVELGLAAAGHHVSGDGVRLQQVMWNVLKNAIKFSLPGGRITIRSWDGAGQLRVAFADTGLGITAEEMPRIFTAFAQGREAAASRFGGLGLGLSITALLMREHRGRIWAESAGREQGATFHLALPLAAAPAPVPPAAPPAPQAPPPALRILLVEDHDDTRGILLRLLTRWGHSVTAAASVAQARAALEAGTFDLLLSDLGLPDGSGYDVIAALRAQSGAPAVAMSGYGMEADLDRTRTAGFAQHLVKPVAADRLRELVTRFTPL